MKIRIDFTVEVPNRSRTALERLAGGGPFENWLPDVREFVRRDAEDYLIGYLTDNDVDAKVIQRNGTPVEDTFYGYQPLDKVDPSQLDSEA